MGQSNSETDVNMGGLFPQNLDKLASFKGINRFVIPKGGEYFFMPSMSALRGALAGKGVGAKSDL